MDSVFWFEDIYQRGDFQGSILAGFSGLWMDYTTGNGAGRLENLENSGYFGVSGFDATPGGGIFAVPSGLGTQGFWWTSTSNGVETYYRMIKHSSSGVYRSKTSNESMMSVRCLHSK